MIDMSTISSDRINVIKKLYSSEKLGIPEIAKKTGFSVDALYYFMRKHKIARRSFSDEQKRRFDKKKPSFLKNKKANQGLRIIGTMLYWAEGYKGTQRLPAKVVDFANSDPYMIVLFLKFLRDSFFIDEKKLRVFLYCHANQDIKSIISFWSKLTDIPKDQFTKPYIRKDFNEKANKMENGLVHIRYGDKKLLLEIKNLIDYHIRKYAPVV